MNENPQQEDTMDENPPDDLRLSRLRRWNLLVGLVLAAQAVVIALLTNDFSSPGDGDVHGRATRHARQADPPV